MAASATRARRRATSGGDIPLLQDRLILNRYMCRLLGGESFRDLRERLWQTTPGLGEGHTLFYQALRGFAGLQLPEDQLAQYDLRIRNYTERVNTARTPRLELLYFQYLAVLFSEIFLDKFFNGREKLIRELNDLVRSENSATPRPLRPYQEFTEAHPNKLAFWMATGSGKTLIMHCNLWQYLHYAHGKAGYDNIVLVTPNEGLSRQHLDELRKSGIPAKHYGEAGDGLFGRGQMPLTLIEITKLTENKRGGGLTVDVERFGPNNLLLVDEGHRGASGDVWRELRRRVAETGFTFEYSATFGQIVNGASQSKRPALLEEYSKAIVFDYSYPHFYHDGYGKDYWILNIKDETDTFNDWMLLGNLVSFYEQSVLYQDRREEFRPYNLEKPLWVFVGHSVTGGKSAQSADDAASLTDVQQVVAFFDDFLQHKDVWVPRLEQVVRGDTGVKDPDDRDLFFDRFAWLRSSGVSSAELYDRILDLVFHARRGDALRAVELKQASGEIGLRAGTDSPYFGVINIGDVPGLKKRFGETGVSVGDENISGSLFHALREPDSSVGVLVGSRKFMEGWDSFRVSSMGLMNIGKGEGSQIIQLFGRGVRLHGKGHSLKRSREIDAAAAPGGVEMLETLHVFGIRANYMAEFRKYLKQEGFDIDSEEIAVPVHVQDEFLKRNLHILRAPKDERFGDDDGVVITGPDEGINVTLDLRPRLEVARSGAEEVMDKTGGDNQSAALQELLPLLDWDRIYFSLVGFAQTKDLNNVSFSKEALRRILQAGRYVLLCPKEQLAIVNFGDLRRVEDIATSVLRKYVGACYDHCRRAWEGKRLELQPLTEGDPNLGFGRYQVRVKKEFADSIRELAEKAEQLKREDEGKYPFIHFDRHLYQPLLKSDREIESSAPPGLNEGEQTFVRDLRQYLQDNADQFQGKDVFLLRNLSKGKGVGLFQASGEEGFYPDFILWVLQDRRQWIIFIDPHGIQHTNALPQSKVQTHRRLEDMAPELQAQCQGWDVSLTSFILARGSYDAIGRSLWAQDWTHERLEEEHVLFQGHAGYVAKLFGPLGIGR